MRISDWSSDVALPISSRSPNGQSRATDWWGIGINLDHRSHRFSDPARLAPAPCNFRRYVGTALIQIDRFSQTAFVKQTVSKPPDTELGVRLLNAPVHPYIHVLISNHNAITIKTN